jgi:uncharacterized protein (DUF1501 family)
MNGADGPNPAPIPDVPGTRSTGRLSRRGFLLGAGAAGAAGLAGAALWGRPWDALAGPASGPRRTGGQPATTTRSTPGGTGPLVLVTLYGGNDGLNTVVPYADSAYHAARPTLGYSAGEVLDLGEGLGLNPQLKGMQSLWKSGHLAIVRGVGYPNPNLSHFASMAIWQTANPTDGTGAGWLGRWLDGTGADPLRAISVGATLPILLRGEKQSATALTAPRITLPGDQDFQDAFASLQAPGADRTGLASLAAASGAGLLQVENRLDQLTPAASPPATEVDASSLAGQLQTVAALINAGTPTRVYQVSLASFDTHAAEKANHERLLTELDQALTAFLAAVGSGDPGRETVVMTYSEFGRRPRENASGGTDHGTAAPLFVAGPTVQGGRFYGEEPSLTALDVNGNVKFSTDFRSVYATVLEQVIGVDSAPILGGRYPTLGFV